MPPPTDWNSLDYRVRRQLAVQKYEHKLLEAYQLPNQLQDPIPDEDIADLGDFPANIQEHFWIREDTVDSGEPWMSVGQLTNENYFYFRGSKEERSTEICVTPSFKKVIDYALRDRYKFEYSGGSSKPSFPGELPQKRTLMESPYRAWISGTHDPDEPILSPWEIRLSKGLLPCFACSKDFRWREPGEYMCSTCSDVNKGFVEQARKKEEERQKQRATAQKV